MRREKPLPILFIGVGEKLEHLQSFRAVPFANALKWPRPGDAGSGRRRPADRRGTSGRRARLRTPQCSHKEATAMLLGAVDLGSNSFRVVIARVEGANASPQSYWKETIRLAGGFDENGALTPEAQARLAALALSRMPLGIPERVRAVGTQAMRARRPTPTSFFSKLQEALGYRIDILSGHEEARLVFKSCAQTLPPSDKRRLVIDIGARAPEFIIGTGTEPFEVRGYKIGCVNTSIRFFPRRKFSAKAFDRAVVASLRRP